MPLLIHLLYLSLSQQLNIPGSDLKYLVFLQFISPQVLMNKTLCCCMFRIGFPTSCLRRHVRAPMAWYLRIVFLHAIFWVLWCNGKITKADAPTTRLDTTQFRPLVPPPPSSPPFFHFYAGCPSCCNFPNLSWRWTGTKYAGLHSQWLGFSITLISWKILLTLMGSVTVSISLQNNNTEHCTATVTAGAISI